MDNNIKHQIELHDVISFDIFDTLLYRPYIEPSHMFKHMELALGKRGFYKNRIIAEQTAHKNSKYEDVTLDEIYTYIHPDYADLKQTELDFEQRCLTQNPRVYEIYKYARDLNKKIVFISDMYLPKDFLITVLAKNGYDYFDEFFLSGESRKAKYSGNLFKICLKEFNILPNRVLHFGDHDISDVKMPRSLGIDTIQIKKNSVEFFEQHKQYLYLYNKNKESLTLSILISLMIDKWAKSGYSDFDNNSYWYKFGYNVGGHIALGFATFYLTELAKTDCKQWLFIARDGYWLHKITSILSQNTNIFYIYAQRVIGYNALRIEEGEPNPDLQKLSEMNIKKYADYLKSQGINPHEKIGIIDSGTAAFTAQRLIERALGVKTTGIYTHIYKQDIALNLNCDYRSWTTEMTKIKNITSLVESVLMAPERPVVDIQNNKPVYMDNITKHEEYRNKITVEIGQGICDFVKRYKEFFGDNIFVFSATDVNALMQVFVGNMTKTDSKNLSSVSIPYDAYNKIYKKTLKEFVEEPMYKKIKLFGIPFIAINHKYDKSVIYLFKFIPVLVFKQYKYLRLFGFIPLIKVKYNSIYLFEFIKMFKIYK